eukprot:symbB.v1.2.036746.t1/scaffold5257.1/size29319/3
MLAVLAVLLSFAVLSEAKLKVWPSDGEQIWVEANLTWLDVELQQAPEDDCSYCFPSADATEEDLLKLYRFNCERIRRANTDFSNFAERYGQAVDASWKTRITKAQSLCDEAGISTLKSATLATCAWGDVLMRKRECCNVPGPPYCVSSTGSQVARAFVLLFALLLSCIAVSLGKCCQQTFYMPTLIYCDPPEAMPITPGEEESAESTQQTSEPEAHREALQAALKKIWERSVLKNLSEAQVDKDLKQAKIVDVFVQHCIDFDFQEDSVQNQFEHFISLWLSHCAVCGDRGHEEVPRKRETPGLFTLALESLERELLFGYNAWREELEQRVQSRGAGSTDTENKEKLKIVALYLLVWGESGNLRFMPEMLYFITWILHHSPRPRPVRPGRSNAFLVQVVRPIYKVVFDEHHEKVDVKNGKDAKKLRENYDTYLPADSANYDDWNELFMDVNRLLAALPWVEELPENPYENLTQVNWKEKLHSDKVKTHRELHSWWGVFAATHRLWFLHLLLFLLCMYAVSDKTYSSGKGWKVFIAGNDAATCLSSVLMVVPLHIFAWRLGCWFTTGMALRHRCSLEVLGCMFWNGLAFASCLTFFWVRYVDAIGRNDAWSSEVFDIEVAWPFATHVLVCCLGIFAILYQPFQNGHGLSQVKSASMGTKSLRWMFWILVMTLKVWASFHGVVAIEKAMSDLKISRPGRETLAELPKISFGPNWDKDMIQWLAIWGTGFVCFIADTQFWFVVGCSILGFILACAERGWALKSFIKEDPIARLPERFSKRVILNHVEPEPPLVREAYISPRITSNDCMSRWFPALWDLVVDFMRCEDKLDDFTAAQMKFNVRGHAATIPVGEHPSPPWQAMKQLCERELHPYNDEEIEAPSIFEQQSYGQRFIERYAGIIQSDSWPKNLEVQWRLNAFARNLGSKDLPRPFLPPYVPGITVLIPHYGEQILMVKDDLHKKTQDSQNVPLIAWLEKRYHAEFIAFTNRLKAQHVDWPDIGTNWDSYNEEHWKHICLWASMRSQTFWRTVEGCMFYLPALERFYEMVSGIKGEKLLKWDPSAVFTCMGCMQNYANFKPEQFDHADQLLKRFPRSFQIAYIDHEAKPNSTDEESPNDEWENDQLHPRQQRRYYSCLIDSSCKDYIGRSLQRKPRFRVELPGFSD